MMGKNILELVLYRTKWVKQKKIRQHEFAVINDSLTFGQVFGSQNQIKGQAYKCHG